MLRICLFLPYDLRFSSLSFTFLYVFFVFYFYFEILSGLSKSCKYSTKTFFSPDPFEGKLLT